MGKIKQWLGNVFSDGGKPSMARILLVPLTVVTVYCVAAEKEIQDNFSDIYMANVAWAGGGAAVLRWVQAKKGKLNENSTEA